MEYRKLTAIIAALCLLGLPAGATPTEAKSRAHHRHVAHRHQPQRHVTCPVHQNAEGDLIDCMGWRYRASVGWDNTCFKLDYLPSAFACSPGGGGW